VRDKRRSRPKRRMRRLPSEAPFPREPSTDEEQSLPLVVRLAGLERSAPWPDSQLPFLAHCDLAGHRAHRSNFGSMWQGR